MCINRTYVSAYSIWTRNETAILQSTCLMLNCKTTNCKNALWAEFASVRETRSCWLLFFDVSSKACIERQDLAIHARSTKMLRCNNKYQQNRTRRTFSLKILPRGCCTRSRVEGRSWTFPTAGPPTTTLRFCRKTSSSEATLAPSIWWDINQSTTVFLHCVAKRRDFLQSVIYNCLKTRITPERPCVFFFKEKQNVFQNTKNSPFCFLYVFKYKL